MNKGGWEESAEAWIASMGEEGDWSRKYVLDPCYLDILSSELYGRVLDVGCGEGRFCRRLASLGFEPVGIDPTARLLEQARDLDPSGEYHLGSAEAMPFGDDSFDLVISYLTLLDIPDFRAAIREMARVLRPGGRLMVANIGNHASSSATGWVKDEEGNRLYYPVDNYLDELEMWVGWKGIHIVNYHRPLSAYMAAFLGEGLVLEKFLEPEPVGCTPDEAANYKRVPWFSVVVWRKN